jgi:hypothetical protein
VPVGDLLDAVGHQLLAMTAMGRRVPFTTGSPKWMFGSISMRSVSSQATASFSAPKWISSANVSMTGSHP